MWRIVHAGELLTPAAYETFLAIRGLAEWSHQQQATAASELAGLEQVILAREAGDSLLSGSNGRLVFEAAADGDRELKAQLMRWKPDILHIHGFWNELSERVLKWAHKLHIPVVFSPHGAFEAWSLNRHRMRKAMAWRWQHRTQLALCALVMADSRTEKDNLLRLGVLGPSVGILPLLPPQQTGAGECQRPYKSDQPYILTAGPLFGGQGLDFFLRVWKYLRPMLPEWRWVLAGPDAGGFGNQLYRNAAMMKLHESLHFTGEITGEARRKLFAGARFFVRPTYGEGFGYPVLEALRAGIPTAVAMPGPWASLVQHEAGWWLPHREPLWIGKLKAILTGKDNDKLLRDVSIRARALGESFPSDRLCYKYWLESYAYVVGAAQRPAYFMNEAI